MGWDGKKAAWGYLSERWPQLEGAQPRMSCAAGRSTASGGACSARAKAVELFLKLWVTQNLHWQNEAQWCLHSQGDGTDRQTYQRYQRHRTGILCCSACLLVFWEKKKMKSEVSKPDDERKLFSIIKWGSNCERGVLHWWLCNKITEKILCWLKPSELSGKNSPKYTYTANISKLVLTITGRSLGVISAHAQKTSP